MKDNILKPEDYAEPRCVLCGDPYGKAPEVKPVPQQRIIQKMDEYMSRRDYDGAERHLKYWLEEAKLGHDLRGQLTIQNEMIGHYRKRGQQEPAFQSIEAGLQLLKELDFEGTISSATTYTNAATAYYTFGAYEKSLEYFALAKAVYEANERTAPDLLGGLYNNMALTCVALRQFSDAYALYDQAMEVMGTLPEGVLEQAITCLNRANALEAELGMDEAEPQIFALLDQAENYLKEGESRVAPDGVSQGYYAFVCETCAPTFAYYGYFLTAEKLQEKAKEIYERD